MAASEVRTVDIVLSVERAEDEAAWRKAVARKARVRPERIRALRLLKKSIDARKAPVKFQLRLEVGIDGPLPEVPSMRVDYPLLRGGEKQVVIVGCGPAGLFAGLQCLELGLKPVILERGKDVSARRFDLAPILREGRVIEESNYCFGEGGAGTFSDGKLYTRATKRGPVRKVYETLVAHGAPPDILVDAHPHIGSNLLPNVVRAMRESVRAAGGEVRFGVRVEDLLLGKRGVAGVRANGEEISGEAVILATGHSARDIYRLLDRRGLLLERKPFAMGVRIEHPQPFIDSCQYHYERGHERPRELPAARYRLATRVEDRSVHSFCMCPGGFIVPCATENDEVVVNGMSLSRRDSPFANSGMVVGIEPEDTEAFVAEHGNLAGIVMQKELECTAKKAGGGGQQAPAQRVVDFLTGTVSDKLPKTSYFPGVQSAPLHELLPSGLASRLAEGLRRFGRQIPGYDSEEALLVGFETRTSSPVRIPRLDDTLMHPDVPGLVPAGEGAGYAGGIVSAALDGARCAEAAAAHCRVS